MNSNELKKLASALLPAILATLGQSVDTQASVKTATNRASLEGKRVRATSPASNGDDISITIANGRTRLRDVMAASGKCILVNSDGETVSASIDSWQDSPRARISLGRLQSILPDAEEGRVMSCEKIKAGRYRVSLAKGKSAGRSVKSASVKKSSGFDVESLFESPKSEGHKSASSASSGKSSSVKTFCPVCEDETKHKQVASLSKKGRTVYRVTCSVCHDEHAKGTEGQHKQWAAFRAEHTDATPARKGKVKAIHVKGKVTAKQAEIERKRASAAANNRKRSTSYTVPTF
jgi:hypothetical protein